MTRWEEAFKNHEVHGNLRNITINIESLINNDISDEALDELRRLLKIFLNIQNTFETADPDFFPLNTLSDLNALLIDSSFVQELEHYRQDGNTSHLTNANNTLTKRFTSIQNFYHFGENTLPKNEIYEETLKSFINNTNKKIKEIGNTQTKITNGFEEAKKILTELSSRLEGMTSRVDGQINEWQNQFSQSQQSRLSEQSETLNRFREEFDSVKQNAENYIRESRDQYTNLISKSTSDIQNDKTKIMDEYISELEKIEGKSKEIHKKIVDLYNIVSRDSISGNYQRVSEDEKKSADSWRNRSIAATIFTIIWLIFSLFKGLSLTETGEIIIGKLILTVSISLIMIALSAYCAQQSTKHRNNETRTQWFALEVSAINPFIENLDESQKRDLINKLSEKIFGNFDTLLDKNTNREISINEYLDKITGLVKEIKKE